MEDDSMEIKLNRLMLENFKGVKVFLLEANGRNSTVRGENGAGKTTLADAFHWLLFGKDSNGRADFAIKTLDAKGQEIHNLNHSVEAVLEIDGRPITLLKVFKEKWTKKRGSARAEFTGHTTDFFIDGVPVQQKEWTARLQGLIDEYMFRLLTNPAHFNSLHWQKRRELLLAVCGDVSDKDVIASDKELASLPSILNGHNHEELRKIIAAKKKEINDRLKEIPARIDEASRSIVDVSGYNAQEISIKIGYIKKRIEEAKADSGSSALRIKKAELTAKQAEIQTKLDWMKREAEKSLDKDIDELESANRAANRSLQETVASLQDAKTKTERNEKEMERLREEYTEISGKEYTGPDVCPTCGQNLPSEQVAAALERHNLAKAQVLADINARGKALKTATADLYKEWDRLDAKRQGLEQDIRMTDARIKEARERKPGIMEGVGKLEKRAIEGLRAEIAVLDAQIMAHTSPDTTGLETELNGEQAKLAQIEASKKTAARIEVLKAEEKELAGKYEELERQTYLLERFTVSKVGLLEGKINSKFELARFKLFDTQVNGGIQETCVTLYNGVPYGAGLNTGAEINVGLDIIKTLSRHYGIKAPVWIDHKESVTKALDPETQTIMLTVDERCPKLEVTYNG
jgi:chromosome segregation ATPase